VLVELLSALVSDELRKKRAASAQYFGESLSGLLRLVMVLKFPGPARPPAVSIDDAPATSSPRFEVFL